LNRLRDLCFELDINFENLGGDTLNRKTIELIQYCERYERYEELVRTVLQDNAHLASSLGVALSADAQKDASDDGVGGRDLGRRSSRKPVPMLGPIRERWALLVGVNHYDDPAIPDLRYCVADVKALEGVLTDLSYTVLSLYDDHPERIFRPTRVNVQSSLRRLCQQAQPEDMLLAYFACHGKIVNGKRVLITTEARENMLAEEALTFEWVQQELRREATARRAVVLLDACHVGLEMGRSVTDPEFIRNVHELAQGYAVIAASTSQQVAHEINGHGVFSHYVLEGMRGAAQDGDKGFVTVNSLGGYVLNEIRKWNVKAQMTQEPTTEVAGMGDMILADYRSAR
jgi:hypothetical protein